MSGVPLMDHNEMLLRYVYIPLAALSGSISSFGARRWQTMSKSRVFLTIMTGFSFAAFVAPWMAHRFIGISEDDARGVVAITYLSGIGGHLLIPAILKWMERVIGAGEAK